MCPLADSCAAANCRDPKHQMLRHATLVAAPSIVTLFAEAGTVNVTSVRCSGSANSISTLCWPGGSPTTTIVLLSLKSPPMPRQVVDGNMQMADPRRTAESARPEHR